MTGYLHALQILLIVIGIYVKETTGVLTHNACNNKNNCHDCIQTSNCAWCTTPDYKEDRCFQYNNLNSSCNSDAIYYPQTSKVLKVNRPLTSDSSTKNVKDSNGAKSRSQEFVQLKPQHLSLKLRANEIFSIPLTYSRAAGYPIDLYYLMDLSRSMENDKKKLSSLGDSLADTMRNITTDFRLGFGSFIDKVRMPFTQVSSALPCHRTNDCSDTYSYRNVMPLSKDIHRFAFEVKNAVIGENIDAPEGGLDAMMQAIVCRKEIGWRETARRLLVFSTDATFHSAGDGKLAGLIEPNDLKCHLDNQGNYTHAEILDYPSVGAISHTVKDNYINVIFAVTHEVFDEYELLSNHIDGSSCAALTEDSSNVVKLVQEQYQQISSTIQMRSNATSPVKVSFYSACGKNTAEIPTSKCDGVHIGDEIIFTVNISFTSCPSDPRDWRQVIQISPVGINESLIIDLEMLCGCECELQTESASPYCSSHGDLVCGVCVCDELHVGAHCQCSNTDNDEQSESEGNHSCYVNTTQTQYKECSGRGSCACGVCQCDKRANSEEVISGKYCQCDNFSCERHEQKICSGPERGTCECGKCACKPGWTGTACGCHMSMESCMPPGGDLICSGQGTCECGECKCQTTAQGPFSGQYCEMCPTCSSRCDELKDCVQCQMYKTGVLKDGKPCGSNCTRVKTTPLDNDAFDRYELIEGEKKCTFYDDDNCKFSFIFREIEGGVGEVRAKRERECWAKVALFRILGGVIGGVLGIGLATLLFWKMITTMQDRREYKRFEKERLNAEWGSGNNPLYKQATSTFQNPMCAN